MSNTSPTLSHEMAVNQGQVLQDIQRTIRRGFRQVRREVRQVRLEVRRDLARLYVDESCIQLFKDEVANINGSSELNFAARLMNRSITRPNALLEPLYGINNQPIANFPRTSGHLGRLRGMYPNSRETKTNWP